MQLASAGHVMMTTAFANNVQKEDSLQHTYIYEKSDLEIEKALKSKIDAEVKLHPEKNKSGIDVRSME